MKNNDFSYEIIKELGIVSESKSGWKRELNLISWNGASPKYDLLDWAPEHEKWEKELHCLRRKLRNYGIY